MEYFSCKQQGIVTLRRLPHCIPLFQGTKLKVKKGPKGRRRTWSDWDLGTDGHDAKIVSAVHANILLPIHQSKEGIPEESEPKRAEQQPDALKAPGQVKPGTSKNPLHLASISQNVWCLRNKSPRPPGDRLYLGSTLVQLFSGRMETCFMGPSAPSYHLCNKQEAPDESPKCHLVKLILVSTWRASSTVTGCLTNVGCCTNPWTTYIISSWTGKEVDNSTGNKESSFTENFSDQLLWGSRRFPHHLEPTFYQRDSTDKYLLS